MPPSEHIFVRANPPPSPPPVEDPPPSPLSMSERESTPPPLARSETGGGQVIGGDALQNDRRIKGRKSDVHRFFQEHITGLKTA